MPSLEDHFRALTKVRTPEDWPDLEPLTPRPLGSPAEMWPEPRPHRLGIRSVPGQRHRVAAAALAFAIAVAGIGFAIWTFGGASRSPQPRPAAAVEDGKIAFVAGDFPAYEIFTVNPDGSDLSKLGDGRDPAWSPDGTRLAFTINRPGLGIALINADGTGRTELTHDVAYAQSPSWSPDGTEIAFAAQDGIYVMSVDGTDIHRVAGYTGPLACADFEPSWSPDGTTIAWAVRCDGGGLGIWTVRPDGSGLSTVVDAGSGLSTFNYPTWSPDGTLLAFEGGRPVYGEAPGPILEMGIYVVGADGSGLTKLAEGTQPAWSPDGTKIAFASDRDGAIALYTMEIDGTNPVRLTDTGADACCPVWQPVLVSEVAPSPTPSVGAAVAATTTVGADGAVRSVVYGEGAVWVAVSGEPSGPGTVLRIDPETDEIVATISVDAVPGWEVGGAGVTIGAGSVWVTGSVEDPSDPPIGTDAVLLRIDPSSNEVSATIALGGEAGGDVIVGESGVWVAVGDKEQGELVRVDPATNEIVARIPIPYKTEPYQDLRELVGVDGIILVNQLTFENGGSAITAVEAATNQVLGTAIIRVPEDIDSSIGPLVAWNGQVWADNGYQLVRIDPRTGQLLGEAVQLPEALAAGLLVADDRGLWFLGYDGRTGAGPRTLSLLDPETGEVQTFVDVPGIAPSAMAVGPSSVWILDYHGMLTRINLA